MEPDEHSPDKNAKNFNIWLFIRTRVTPYELLRFFSSPNTDSQPQRTPKEQSFISHQHLRDLSTILTHKFPPDNSNYRMEGKTHKE